MIYEAHELQEHFNAGLLLAGRDDDGELVWIGDRIQWQMLGELQNAYVPTHMAND